MDIRAGIPEGQVVRDHPAHCNPVVPVTARLIVLGNPGAAKPSVSVRLRHVAQSGSAEANANAEIKQRGAIGGDSVRLKTGAGSKVPIFQTGLLYNRTPRAARSTANLKEFFDDRKFST